MVDLSGGNSIVPLNGKALENALGNQLDDQHNPFPKPRKIGDLLALFGST